MGKGFTLLELIVVIIILGILATLGFTQYTKMVERGRISEAKIILGQLRTAEIGYFLQNGEYTRDITLLSVNAPTICTTTHFFLYECDGPNGLCTAYRCTSGGKTPDFTTSYRLWYNSATETWTGTQQGYY